MEKHEFILHPSLQQMAMIKVAINVWNGAENLNLLNQLDYENIIFPEEMKEKVSLFALPNKIKEELLNTLELIALQMLRWKERHTTSVHNPGYFLDKLCWTSVGTVDNCKTAKTLIKQEWIDMSTRYRLACLYCFENDIPLIWEKLSDDAQKYFIERSSKMMTRGCELTGIWTHKINHEKITKGRICKVCESDSTSDYRDIPNSADIAFKTAVASANKEGVEFFVRKLTPDERKACLVSPITFIIWMGHCYNEDLYKKLINFNDVVVYLLSQLNVEEQVEIFKCATLPCVISFLEWPWHVLFKKVAKISLKYFNTEDFEMALKLLVTGRKICGYYFTELLDDFLQESPDHLKDHFTKISFNFKRRFFNSYNLNCINIILRNLGTCHKRQLFITSKEGRRHCIKLMDEKKWNLLELFIADSALLENDKTRVKEAFMNAYLYACEDEKDENWARFFGLIDKTGVGDCSKRKLEGMEAGEWSGKKLK